MNDRDSPLTTLKLMSHRVKLGGNGKMANYEAATNDEEHRGYFCETIEIVKCANIPPK